MWTKSYGVTILMKSFQKYFRILYKMKFRIFLKFWFISLSTSKENDNTFQLFVAKSQLENVAQLQLMTT